MTDLADLVLRLFWLHEDVTNDRLLPFMRHWDEHGDALNDASRLTPAAKDELLVLCLDLMVQFARTCTAAVGPACLPAVVEDAAGRGWQTTTSRSQTVAPTLACIPPEQIQPPWTLEDALRQPEQSDGLTSEEKEALWRQLLAEEPFEEVPRAA